MSVSTASRLAAKTCPPSCDGRLGTPFMWKLRYRLNYWKRVILLAIGLCPKCTTRVNYTSTGRPICPNCAH